jgi:dipeptidyl aminopeptidase/acylaminoacyl peptidase
VLQPNFRGSSGYGDQWFRDNGFRQWKVAIGDVNDAGRWLVKQGIADPRRLGIVGWSYGGYAALQSGVLDPGLFKGIVAIAPVTDLDRLREQYRGWSNRFTASEFIGSVDVAKEASPARHAQQIKAPVLLFHGGLDRNVHIDHSKMMATRLQSAGVPNRLITWDNLDHYLEDSDARITMLRTSDEWLKAAFAGKPAPQQ